jgi:hypothetical protein
LLSNVGLKLVMLEKNVHQTLTHSVSTFAYVKVLHPKHEHVNAAL